MTKMIAASAMLAGTALYAPRAVAGSVRADASMTAVLAELKTTFEAFKAENEAAVKAKADDVLTTEKIGRIDASLTELQGALDEQARLIAAAQLGGPVIGDLPATDPEYVGAFKAHVRKGEINAALSVGSAPDGGYLAPVEWDRTITDRLKLVSPMRAEAEVQSVGTSGFIRLFNNRAIGSGWVGETAARPETSTPQLQPLTFASGEIYAMPMATQQLLDDAVIDVEAWLQSEIATEFDRQEGIAFIAGDGINKPRGFLTYVTGGSAAAVHPWGAISIVNSGAATTFTADGVIDLQSALPSMYISDAKFYASRGSFAAIRKLKDGQGNYLWQPSYQAGTPATLAGYPLVEMPDMPAVAANALSLAFGDMRQAYLILDRIGVRMIRDPLMNKPYVGFYTTKRVGGGLQNPDALKVMRIAA